MTTKEAAALWGVTPETVRRYCASGRIKHCGKVKGKWVINPLCHKPFDMRFKNPTIVVCSVVKDITFNENGEIVSVKHYPPLIVPTKVRDGLVVVEEREMLLAA